MEWRLRRAETGDAAACSLVAGATFLEAFADILDGPDIVAHIASKSDPATFTALIADPASVVTLAETSPRAAPLGYAVLTTPDLPIPAEEGDIELRRIYTLIPTHGTGVGPALMERAFADARTLGRRRILLGVYGGNHRAQRFYTKQGFTVVGERRFLVGSTWHDDLIFARAL
ncbi:MAG: GNAT family N-acetyltransferase [Candidatus Sphingomonas colombiensis]|nr:GNAT family N-acetyltransferase [Sphingomonas sp.]WEK42756.1 MAG: GNAT family N-acetyltransferase [Sphingomonas sp.]